MTLLEYSSGPEWLNKSRFKERLFLCVNSKRLIGIHIFAYLINLEKRVNAD